MKQTQTDMNYEFEITITKEIGEEIGLKVPKDSDDYTSGNFWDECGGFTITNEAEFITRSKTVYSLNMPFEVDLLIDHDSDNEDKIYEYLANEFPNQ